MRRAAMMLLVMMLTTMTAWAQGTVVSINVTKNELVAVVAPFTLNISDDAIDELYAIVSEKDNRILLYPVSTVKPGTPCVAKFNTDTYSAEMEVTLTDGKEFVMPWEGGHMTVDAANYTWNYVFQSGEGSTPGQSLGKVVLAFSDPNEFQFNVNLENLAARRYLERVYYSDASDESSVAEFKVAPPARRDIPNAVMLPLPPFDADNLVVNVRDNDTEETVASVTVARGETEAYVYNLLPQHHYKYSVNDNEVGKFETVGHLRMVYAPSAYNIRDLGGWETQDRSRTTYGHLFRGSALNGYVNCAPEDIQALKDLGIGGEIDLRWKSDYDKDMDCGTSAFGFTGDDYYFAAANDYTAANLNESSTQTRLKQEFEFIIDHFRQGKAVYLHGTWGADRTGMLSFLLEGLLGMTIDQIYKDYELSSFSAAPDATNCPKTLLQDCIDVILALDGATLRDKFENYFLNKLQVPMADITYFRSVMLDIYPLRVDEDADLTGYYDGRADITFHRTLQAGKHNTVVLPCDLTLWESQYFFGEGTKIENIVAYEDGVLKTEAITKDTDIAPANKPFLLIPTSVRDDNTYTLDDVPIRQGDLTDATFTCGKMVGSYAATCDIAKSNESGKENYVISNNQFYVIDATPATMKGTCAYLVLDTPSDGVKSIVPFEKLMTNDDISATVPNQTLEGPNNPFDNINYKFEYANNNYSESYAQDFITAMGVVVKDGETVLSLGTDYLFGSVTLADGNPIGEYSTIGDVCKVEIVGKGAYTGSRWATFTVISPSANGTHGDLSWSVSAGTLSINGTGAMTAAATNAYPWYNYCSIITNISIGEGVTSIADNAFGSVSNINTYSNVTKVFIPSTVTSIGADAFKGCISATDVYCYADHENLTWGDTGDDFKSDGSTVCHVDVASDWSGFTDVNVTFVGDLANASIPYIAADGSKAYRKYGEYTVLTSSTSPITLGSDGETTWYVVNSDVTVDSRIFLTGNTNLILGDGCTLDVKGIYIPQGSTLTIYAQSDGVNAGKIVSKPTSGAAIGGISGNDNGNIVIHGGIIEATGANNCAGIGGGDGGSGGTITIYGGDITANGPNDSDTCENGAGIGGGKGGDGGTITINGGTITTYSRDGAGIGGGDDGGGGTITINGGAITSYKVNQGQGARIGGGCDAAPGTIIINGGTITTVGGSGAGIGGGKGNTAGGTVIINGGIINASGSYGIGAGEEGADVAITLGWTNADDRITASSYNGSVTIADGKSFYDGSEILAPGIVADNSKLAGKTLQPFKTITLADNADNSSAISEWKGGMANVTLSGRTLYKDGFWNTICLPFDMTAEQVTAQLAPTKLMTLSSSAFEDDELTLNFEGATTIEAGKPYIIKWTSGDDVTNPEFSGVTIKSAQANVETTYVDFIGNYGVISFTDEDKSVLLMGVKEVSTNNYVSTLYYPTSGAGLRAFRAYFQLNGLEVGSSSNAIKSFNLNFDVEGEPEPEVADAIMELKGERVEELKSEGWYTMSGVRLNGKPTAKGMYIHDGRKVMIK